MAKGLQGQCQRYPVTIAGFHLPDSCPQALDVLDFGKGIGESCLRLVDAADAATEQEVRGSIKSEPKEHVHHVHFPFAQLDYELLHMFFKDLDIAQPVFDKLRTD